MKKFDSLDGLNVACCSGIIRWPSELNFIRQRKAKRQHLVFKEGEMKSGRQGGEDEEEKQTEGIDSKALKSEELPESTETWWWDRTGESFTDVSVLSSDRGSPGVSDWIESDRDAVRSPGAIFGGLRDSAERIENPDQLKACRHFPEIPGPVLENAEGTRLEEEYLEERWKPKATTIMNQENRRQIVVDDDYLCADDRYQYHHHRRRRRRRHHHHHHRRQQQHQLQQCQDDRGLCHSVKDKLQLNRVNDKVQRVGAAKDFLHRLDPHPSNANDEAIIKTQRSSQTSHLRTTDDCLSPAINCANSCFCCTNSVLIDYAARGNHEAVLGLIESPGLRLSVNSRDCLHGNTALHLASANGHSRLVRELIMRGANVSLQNQLGETCLHTAAKYGHNKCVRILLNRGCNPLCKEKRYGDTVLHTAVRHGHSRVVQTLLTACSCIIHRRNLVGETALDIVLSQSDKDEAVKLIAKFSRLEPNENKQNTRASRGFLNKNLCCHVSHSHIMTRVNPIQTFLGLRHMSSKLEIL